MERLTFVKSPKYWNEGRFPTKYTSRKTFQEVVARLAYYEDMEEQGRLFIPPCAVRENVWCISKVNKMVSQYTVAGYLHDGIRWKVRLTKTIPSWVGNKTEHKYVAVKAYGITFFKTREEAENALKGGAN